MANDNKSLELQIRVATDEALKAVSTLKWEMSSLAEEAKKLSESDGQAVAATFRQTQVAAEKAAASIKLFGSSSEELRKFQEQLKTAAVELVTKGFDPQSDEVKKLVDEYKRLEKEAADLDEATGKNINSFDNLQRSIKSLAEVAALLKTLSVIKDMGAFALQAADNFQAARNQFGILLGDMQTGAGLFNEIKDFNDKTPFDLDTLTQVTNVLITAKVPLKDLQAQLTKFGDLAQGNSQKLTSYVNAFSQAAAKGKADMQVLNTYLHQGVPILDALAEGFGVTTDEVVEMSSQGRISFADFSKALDELTSAGGRYFGGMELASQSLSAMQEGLREATNSLAASFGEILMPAAIAIVEVLTDITNAINESPMLKGFFAGALVMIAGLLAAMAVKATIAFAAQMSLNFAMGVLNPVVLAATIAVAGLAAGYTAVASCMEEADREAENFAYQQRQQKDAVDATRESIEAFARALEKMSDADLDLNINLINREINEIKQSIEELESLYARAVSDGRQNLADYWAEVLSQEKEGLDRVLKDLENAQSVMTERRTNWIDSMFGDTQAGKIEQINEKLATARRFLSDPNLGSGDGSKLQEIIKKLTSDLERLTEAANGMSEIDRMASKWKDAWADFLRKDEAGKSLNPFAEIDYEHEKKRKEAWDNYVRTANKETFDQIDKYYEAQRKEKIEDLSKEEARIQRELTKTKIDDLEYERDEALRIIGELRDQRIFAAEYTGEDIETILEQFQSYLDEKKLNFDIEINTAELEEARESIKDWQQELSDSLVRALMDMEFFGDRAAVILGELSAQFIELSASATLSGFEEFGRALGEGENAADSLSRALASMCQQILRQLPMMFLQAGLQLIANGQWALGLGFIAAAGSSAIISGYVDGASKHAQGGVFDEYGKAARAFAAGGTFTNQIVSRPTYFRHGGGLGLMGEAGPEAIMPLKRMANGDLGISANGGSGSQVTVNIINNSGAEVRQEEREDGNGGKQIDVIIGEIVNSHIASGKADRTIGARYGLRAAGV